MWHEALLFNEFKVASTYAHQRIYIDSPSSRKGSCPRICCIRWMSQWIAMYYIFSFYTSFDIPAISIFDVHWSSTARQRMQSATLHSISWFYQCGFEGVTPVIWYASSGALKTSLTSIHPNASHYSSTELLCGRKPMKWYFMFLKPLKPNMERGIYTAQYASIGWNNLVYNTANGSCSNYNTCTQSYGKDW